MFGMKTIICIIVASVAIFIGAIFVIQNNNEPNYDDLIQEQIEIQKQIIEDKLIVRIARRAVNMQSINGRLNYLLTTDYASLKSVNDCYIERKYYFPDNAEQSRNIYDFVETFDGDHNYLYTKSNYKGNNIFEVFHFGEMVGKHFVSNHCIISEKTIKQNGYGITERNFLRANVKKVDKTTYFYMTDELRDAISYVRENEIS